MRMKVQELYDLRFGAKVTSQKRSAMFWKRICEPIIPYPYSTYVNSDEAPITRSSVTGSLIMRNLTGFLGLGIARLMGKKTRKRDNTISYQTLRLRPYFPAGWAVSFDSSSPI
jgi:hypothetical protein